MPANAEDGAPGGAAPLAGLVVVSFEQAVAAPYCTRLLADLGARVIKVERPHTGDFARDYDTEVNGMATHFVWLNRNKESMVVDFKAPGSDAVLEALLDRADVVVQNLAPGVASGLGIDAATVVRRRPSVVAVDISGYGTGGPLDDRRAYDLLVQAEAGSCAMTGTADAPAKPGIPIADVGAGLQAAVAVLAALNGRHGSGRGVAIRTSLFDSVADLLGFGLLHAAYTGAERPPNGLSSPVVSPYGAYPTRDGRTVVLGTTNDAEWQRLSKILLGRPDLAADLRYASNPQRCEHRPTLDAHIGAWTRTLDLAEICARADAAGIGNAEFHRVREVVDHPQLVERGRWREVDSPVGPVRSLLPAFIGAGWPDLLNPVPGLGEHTAAIRAELGLSESGSAASAADA
ncbi:CoA transferase [Nocardia sp. NEAU-351]|uniref:CoA transferase n=2 Tax=Nocardia bovistercoris TaxID=2785916 RepID=A0A931N5I8_9NOCA|nr:CoA transferase [Nocardia bovistercoris]